MTNASFARIDEASFVNWNWNIRNVAGAIFDTSTIAGSLLVFLDGVFAETKEIHTLKIVYSILWEEF